MSVPFETTQKIIDAIEYCLSSFLLSDGPNPVVMESFNLEAFVTQVQTLVPEAEPEVIIAYLQLYLTPMGEGEDDFYLGEDVGEGLHENAFKFDTGDDYFYGSDNEDQEGIEEEEIQ